MMQTSKKPLHSSISAVCTISEPHRVLYAMVYDQQLFVQMPFLQAMKEKACQETDVRAIQGWISHSKHLFPRCLAREDYCHTQLCVASSFPINFNGALLLQFFFSVYCFLGAYLFLITPMQTYLLCIYCADLFDKKIK